MTAYLLHLLRHGAPETPGLLIGRTDGAPTAAGVAACVAQVVDLEVAAIASSDLARARRVAEAAGGALGLVPTIDPRWRELDFGDWDGLAPSAIDPVMLGRFWDDPDRAPPPNGERWSSLVDRIAGAIDALASRSTLVVTHGGAMRAALAHLCGFAQPQLWAFDLPYNALLSLRIWPGDEPAAQIAGLRP
jgi:alpha-ribazole phosphatase